MSLNHHKLYLDGVFDFAKTLSIKSEYSAAQINARLIQLHGPQIVDHNQPSTWKYYLNRCGRYHSTDQRMRVISLDTLQQIEFSRETLALNTATAREYQYGTRYYKELVAQYPEQEALILGILYPADMAQALAAPDFSIISYNPALVESNEESLLRELNAWSLAYKRRWWVSGFNTAHGLYAASFFAVYYQTLPLRILELRERACGTAEAHSFHVRMHLAGHNGLDEFLPYLTQKQAMYLYRNVAWHQKHAGQKRSFDALVQNMLTERGLPLIGYRMAHGTENFKDGAIAPSVGFVAEPVNNVRVPSTDMIDHHTLLSKITKAADGNEEFNLREPDAVTRHKYALQNDYPTKVLESTYVDLGEGSALSTIERAISLWVYAACTDRLNVYIRVNNPETGVEVTMSTLDAYYMFLNAYAQAHSSGMPLIPKPYAQLAPQWPVRSLASLWGISIQQEVAQERIEQLRSLMPQARTFINLEQFRDGIEALEEAMSMQTLIVASADTFERQSSYKSVFQALWEDCEFARAESGMESEQYFASKDISMGTLSKQQWQELYLTLFNAVTGLDMQTSAAQSNMQKAMVQIMRRLSSYMVLFVEPQTSTATRALGWSNLVIQEAAAGARSYYEVPIHNTDIRLVENIETRAIAVSIGTSDITFSVRTIDLPLVLDNTSDIVFVNEDNDNRHQIDLANVGVSPVNDEGAADDSFIFGLRDVLNEIVQDETYFESIPNIWNYHCLPRVVYPTAANLLDWVVIDHLNLQAPQGGPAVLGDFKPLSIPQRLRYFSDDADVVELEGIWSNYGNMDVAAFQAAVESAVVDPFRLVPFFQEALLPWTPTVGNPSVGRFDPHAHVPDYVEMAPFQPMPLQQELGLQSTGLPLDVDMEFHSTGGIAQFGFLQGQQGIDINFRSNHRQSHIGALVSKASQSQLAFIQRPFVLNIGKFVAAIVPIEGFRLVNKTAVYQLTSFVMTTRIANIGKLYSYGQIELAPFVNKVRVVEANLGLIQKVAHVNFALQRLISNGEVIISEAPPAP